ncbi:MAG: alpha/beta fold hydrolase [Verrucomicrobiales bacterium]
MANLPLRLRSRAMIFWMPLAIVLLVGFILTWIGSTRFIVPKRRPLEDRHHELLANPAEFGLDLEPISVKLRDGVVLDAIVATRAEEMGAAEKTRAMEARLVDAGILPPAGRRGTIFLLHGRGGRKENLLWVAKRFVAADFRCVVYDARAHGASGGKYCSFGLREKRDFPEVISTVEKRLRDAGESLGPIGAFGNSLGASVILQTLPDLPQVRAVVTVAPFASLEEIVTRSANRGLHPVLPDFLIHVSMRLGGWRAGFDPLAIRPEDDVPRSDIPIYLMHGLLDEVIPAEHSLRILRAAKGREIVWREIPDAYHSNVLAEGGDDHYQEMVEFFVRHLEAPQTISPPSSLTIEGSE